jgi:shikimate dehydrogenase
MPESQPSFLIGLIGSGIQASRTPAMHMLEASRQGLRYVYKLIDLEKLGLGVDALPDLLNAAERLGFDGLNITHPCKQAVIPLLTELSAEARAIGAVNTVALRNGKRYGHNTDCTGFAESFRRGLSGAATRRVVLLGAGGAGAAIAHAALALGIEHLTIFDTDTGKADHLVTALGTNRIAHGTNLAEAMSDADGLIHATPTGMVLHPGLPLPIALLRPEHWVAEIVYFPLETELLRTANLIGCRTLNGSGMAVFQAVDTFRLFSGIQPDAERMLGSFAGMDPK